tara:strand:- start:52 stop:666 length:615 start_codon:yes stop_codon:yes gene_type:complete
MSKIVELMAGRTLEHGIGMLVDHGRGSGSAMYVGGQANADVAAGTTTATSSAENMTAQYAIPANTLVAGSTVRARWVTLSSTVDASGTDNLTCRLRFGSNGTTMTSDTECAVSTAVDQAANDFSVGDMIIQVRTAGSTGTGVAFGTISDSDALGSKLVSAQFEPSFTINTTVVNYVSVSTEFSTTDANLAATHAFVVDIVNPST